MSSHSAPSASALQRHRIRWPEWLWWVCAVACYFTFPDFHPFAASVLIMALFATSLTLLIGFAGIISLGHAAFFGIGAYAAGLLAIAGWREPFSNALVAGLAASLAALIVGPLILRLRGLALLMVTLAIGLVFYELANKATAITGGDDGLVGITMAPVFGRFDWRVDGDTAYVYVLAWLLVVFVPVRRLVNSPFGLSLIGLRENPLRTQLIGTRVLRLRVIAYACSAFMAGIAGALSAQTTAFVGLQVFSIETSVDGLVMAVVGGVANLYGGMVGAPLYMIVKYLSQDWNPFYWMFFVGCLLIVVTRVGRGGALGVMSIVETRVRTALRSPNHGAREAHKPTSDSAMKTERPMSHPALEAEALKKAYGGLTVTDGVSLSLASGGRHALIGPNGAGKSTLVNLLSGVARADAGTVRVFGQDVTLLTAAARCKAGMARTFQISSLFPTLTVLENVLLAVSEHRGSSADVWVPAGRRNDLIDRAREIAVGLGLDSDIDRQVATLAYGKQRLVDLAVTLALEPKVLLLDEPAAGVPAGETGVLMDAIDALPDEITVLMIEHDMSIVRRFARTITVLVQGRVLMSGDPDEVMSSDEVRRAYLGHSGTRRLVAASHA